MEQAESYLPELLNRLEAMIDAGLASMSELAEYLMPEHKPAHRSARVWEWIRGRTRNPNGETALRMQKFAEAKTLEISAAGKKASKAYRQAFDAVKGKPGR